jgi:class 3 adenylate cyclase
MGFASLLAGQLRQGGVYLLGGDAERVALFGAPLPLLPDGEAGPGGEERIAVETSPRLREAFGRWAAAAARNLGQGGVAMPGAAAADDAAERDYCETLQDALRGVVAADRRQGLVNLFWLAHSRELAQELERIFPAPAAEIRYRLHPLLSGILRRTHESSRLPAGRPQQLLVDFRRGDGFNDSLICSVIEDQLPLTEVDPRAFDPLRVLAPGNNRFGITAAAFVEVLAILCAQLERAVAERDRGVLAALERAGARGTPPAGAPPRAWERLVFADPVREQLLHDLDGTASLLRRSRALRDEVSGERPWPRLLGAFGELTRCIRRSEAVHALRSALDVQGHGGDRERTRERYLDGRLLRFGTAHPVASGVRTATILFADIRGFTLASEGPVSEGDLARELYEIFDPAAILVRRFGGRIHAYLGDGFMAGFSGRSRPGEDALAAVRAAVALQQVLGRLRRLGRTAFRMGVSLHTGRVAVARFLRDEEHATTTLIGRQVNIAGRLSASEGEPAAVGAAAGAKVVGAVALDREGHLVNQGIVVSGPLLDVLRAEVACESFSEDDIEGVRWYDPDLCLWLHFGYVGIARFRGVEAALPVYSLGHVAPAGARSTS